MLQHTDASPGVETTEDLGGIVDATIEEEEMVAGCIATEAMKPGGMVIGIYIILEFKGKAQATWKPEAGGTQGEHLETGKA